MSPADTYKSLGLARFPRVSGDEPVRKALNVLAFVFSPRERG